MQKRHRQLIIGLLIIIAIAVLFAYVQRPKPVSVVVSKVSRGEVLSTVTNTRAGTLKACHRSRISPSIGGQIVNLPVKKGDKVRTGQLLLEMWNDDLKARLELARQENQRTMALARQACIMADVAKREARRVRTLLKKDMISEETVDKASSEAQAKLAACEGANIQIRISQSQTRVAQAALDRTRLTAPFSGRVAELNGELGEFLTPSPVGVATLPAIDLIDYTCLYVSAPIDEVDAPQIRTGMPARISLDAFSGQTFDGRVRRVAAYVLDREKQSRTVEIEVDFNHPEDTQNMLPGYSADAEVILQRRTQVLRIPSEALFDNNRVLVLNSDGQLQQRQLKTGVSNWHFTEVIDGLNAGEQVVTSIEREGVKAGDYATIEPQHD